MSGSGLARGLEALLAVGPSFTAVCGAVRARPQVLNLPHVAVASLVDVRETVVRRGGLEVKVCQVAWARVSLIRRSELRAFDVGDD